MLTHDSNWLKGRFKSGKAGTAGISVPCADWQASVSPIRVVCVCHCRVYDCILGGCRVENLGLAVRNCSVETTVVGGTGAREHIDWFYCQENYL